MPLLSVPAASPARRRPSTCRLGGAVCLLWLCWVESASAQGETGKLEGQVRDEGGAPISDASVFLVGSAFAAVTDPHGHYFINNITAGTWSVRAMYLGHRPVEVQGLRILADQTATLDFMLAAAPLMLREITVVAADNPLVPRDEVTTKQRLDGEFADALPIDRLEALLTLQPGVVEANGPQGLSIRGGRPDQAVTYLDGVPVSPGYRGYAFGTPSTQVTVGTNGLEEAAVLTGASSAEFGNTQSGVISLVTHAGGTRLSGAFAVESDEPFGVDHSLGFNRLQASLSGPVAGHLTLSLNGVLEGQASAPGGAGAESAPIFVPVGADTVVRQPSATDDPATETVDEGLLADTTLVTVDRFAVSRGGCDEFRQSANPGIRDNYGFRCQGIRTPASGSSAYQVQGRLNYSYGDGSRLGLSYAASRGQARDFDYGNLFNPTALLASQEGSRVLTLSWTPNLRRSSERALALEVYLSYQQDRTLSGPLTGESERATRSSFGALHLRPFDFVYDFESFPLTEELLANLLSGTAGLRATPTPFPEHNHLVDVYRNDPYGLLGWSESGGPIGFVRLLKEKRYLGKMNLDWQVDRYNRLRVGGELTRYDLTRYQSPLEFANVDFYIERPTRWSGFVENRLDLGDLVLVGGLRYDRYSSGASRPFQLDTTAGSPTFGLYLQGFAPTYTGTFVDGRPLLIHQNDRGHQYLSPHLQVAFPVSTRTNFRFSYAHQVQAPDFASVLRDVNFGGLGTDLDFGKTIAFEFGFRHAFSDDMVLDIAAYNRDDRADAAFRTVRVTDPVTGLRGLKTVVTNLDYGTTRGIDVRFDRRIGSIFNGTLGYGYQSSRNTGSDPGSNLTRGVAALSEQELGIGGPPQAIVPTSFSRPHSLTGAAAFTLPPAWRHGSVLGILADVGVFATFRYVSGTAYTQCADQAGTLGVLSGEDCAGPVNQARLPAFRQLDLRLTKGFGHGRVGVTLYLDARNLLDIRNIVQVYARTGATANPLEADHRWATDSSLFAAEAGANGTRLDDGSIDLGFDGHVASGCGAWVNAGALPAVPNCVYLIRAEERYGDGDHRFTLQEQRRASAAFYRVDRGTHQFLGEPRRLRLGMELTF